MYYIKMADLVKSSAQHESDSNLKGDLTKQDKRCNRTSNKRKYLREDETFVVGSRRARTWKACTRCRIKKTKVFLDSIEMQRTLTFIKCDGDLPCKKCKHDGFVCTADFAKQRDFKQAPRMPVTALVSPDFLLISFPQIC